MSKFLFLDDSVYRSKQIQINFPFVYICETVQQTISLLPTLSWDVVSLDHDLEGKMFVDSSDKNCGMEVVRYLCDNKYLMQIDKIIIHSFNKFVTQEMYTCLMRKHYNVYLKPFKIENYNFLYNQSNK